MNANIDICKKCKRFRKHNDSDSVEFYCVKSQYVERAEYDLVHLYLQNKVLGIGSNSNASGWIRKEVPLDCSFKLEQVVSVETGV